MNTPIKLQHRCKADRTRNPPALSRHLFRLQGLNGADFADAEAIQINGAWFQRVNPAMQLVLDEQWEQCDPMAPQKEQPQSV